MRAQSPAGRRTTWQRQAVWRVLSDTACHLAAGEIHRRLRRRRRRVGLATVYRALEAFVREGLVEPIRLGDGHVRYGLADRHHDHLVCRRCGAWEALDECPGVTLPPALPSGFTITGHQLEVYGYCLRCQEDAG